MNDLRYALRQVINRPGLSIVVVLMLALGIGATTAMYSIFHQVLQRPLPVPVPQELVNLGAPGPKWGMNSCTTAGSCENTFSYPMFRDLEREQTVFTGLAAHRQFGANLAFDGSALSSTGMLVSGQYFDVLNLRPALGRLIGTHDEPQVGESSVVVLSHAYWQNSFGGDESIIGRRLTVNGRSMEIIGVAPEGFSGTTTGVRPSVFVPFTMAWEMMPTFQRNAENRIAYWIYVFGRLKPGISIEQASASLNSFYSGVINEVEAELNSFMPPDVMEQFKQRQITMEPGFRGQSSLPQSFERPLQILLGLTVLVLVIVCVNIANLLLARGASRAGEIAVRASVGASRWQLVRQLLMEAGVLAVLGGLAALPVAAITMGIITAIMPESLVLSLALSLDGRSVVFAAGLAVATVLVFALFPAYQATRTDPGLVLKGQSSQSPGGRGMVRFRGALATVQIAFSMVLLVLAGLFSQSLINVARVDIGMDVDSVVSFAVSPRLNGYSPERAMQIFDRIEDEVAQIPGVTSAASSMVGVLSGNNWQNSLTVEGFEGGPGVNTNSHTNEVGVDYLQTMSIPLLAGRSFTAADTVGSPSVALVNEAFVRKFELGNDAVGRRIGIGTGDAVQMDIEIVGVVADAKYSEVKGETPAQYFRPRAQNENLGQLIYYVRTAGDPDELLRVIPRVVSGIDPDLPVSNLTLMRRTVEGSYFMDRMVCSLSVGFAVLAALLAAIGLYGVLAYNVTQRTREIGLRLALGANPSRLRRMVLRQVGWMGVIGGSIGIAAAIGTGRTAESLLFGVTGWDPMVLALSVVLLSVVVGLSGYLPARRASNVAPMEALRYE